MGKIICLMGKSSTGKDTIFKKLLEDDTLGLKAIVPYTTRPIRNGECDGVEYIFTDEDGFRRLEKQGKVIESRAYHTMLGLWRYFTADDGRIQSEGNYIMINTLEAYGKLKGYFGTDRLLPIMIESDDGIRLQRALDRERLQEHPQYEEMCRRFLADSVDFEESKIKAYGLIRHFDNIELEQCLGEIKEYIGKQIAGITGEGEQHHADGN